jgi:hypothetical protein
MSERVQLSVGSQPVKRRLGDCCEMAASLTLSLLSRQLTKSPARAAVTRGPESRKLENLPR